jgi:peptide/nickel transport system ATP-binding protein
MSQQPLVNIRDFRVCFLDHGKELPAVDGVNLDIYPGEIIGIVGESGSGKSVMSQSILRLREHDSDVRYSGSVLFEGEDLLQVPLSRMREIRGNRISIIFQDALTSLNPVLTVGRQIGETLRLHRGMNTGEARKRSVELLHLMGIPDPEQCVRQYPYELSGGMQQRVMIALALACEPSLLIADEPTTALDVTIQNQILCQIRELNQRLGIAVLLITHDLSVVREMCDRSVVMYLGQIVEQAKTDTLMNRPLHPYTHGLMECVPHLDVDRDAPLAVIPGIVPPLSAIPEGCHFCTRCPYADDVCRTQVPPEFEPEPDHLVRCWRCAPEGRSC